MSVLGVNPLETYVLFIVAIVVDNQPTTIGDSRECLLTAPLQAQQPALTALAVVDSTEY